DDMATLAMADHMTWSATPLLAELVGADSTWVRAADHITAGHSYTLTLISHDDNYTGDATYTLFDDVPTQSGARRHSCAQGFGARSEGRRGGRRSRASCWTRRGWACSGRSDAGAHPAAA